MRILMMGQHFWPEEVSGAVLATQLAESLIQRGHDVTFATSFPNYPQGVVFEGYRGKWFAREYYNNVEIIRTWSYVTPEKALKRRVINYGTFSASVFYAGLIARRPDIVMSYSPPMPLSLTVYLLSRLRQIPWILRVEDLFPEYAEKLGIVKSKGLVRTLESFERFFYRNATHISVISEGFRQKLLERGVPSNKLSVTPVWADPDEIKPMPHHTELRREYNWHDKFIVLYAGNIGMTSSIEEALCAAEILNDYNDIQFVIVGEGVKKADLIQLARTKGLSNISFLPYFPRERFPELLASANALLVTLNETAQSTSLPGKTFSYLASGRPILAVAPTNSELSQLIRAANAGLCVPVGTPTELADAILALKGSPGMQTEMGHNGRKLLETKFSRDHCVTLYETMFERFGRTQ
jgi:colanic acid biosynthesis glycosyl transferase WcaI